MTAIPPKPPTAATIEHQIFHLLAGRQQGATICPSEVARALAGEEGEWRPLMPQIRQVAHSLVQQNRLKVTRGGLPVDAVGGGGPIRLGLADPEQED